MTYSEVSLFQDMAIGKPNALESLYDQYSKLVYGYTLSLVETQQEAEAITIAIFSEMWRAASAFLEWPFSLKSLLVRRAQVHCNGLSQSKIGVHRMLQQL